LAVFEGREWTCDTKIALFSFSPWCKEGTFTFGSLAIAYYDHATQLDDQSPNAVYDTATSNHSNTRVTTHPPKIVAAEVGMKPKQRL